MNSLHLAQDHYVDVAKEADGKSAAEVANAVRERATRLQSYADASRGQTQELLEERATPPSPQDREETAKDLERLGAADADADVIAEAAEHLEQGAKDLHDSTKEWDLKHEEHEGNILGTAYLDQEGTQKFDAAKTVGTTTVVDKKAAGGVGAHEYEHTQQAVQDVAAVQIKNGVATVVEASQDTEDPTIITSTKFTETAAMVAQDAEVPGSLELVSDDYDVMREQTLDFGVTRERIRQLARQKDGLRVFAQEAMAA